jgi:hypothetical protein
MNGQAINALTRGAVCVVGPIVLGGLSAGVLVQVSPAAEGQGSIDAAPMLPSDVTSMAPDEEQERIQAEYGADFALVRTDHFNVISDTSPRYRRTVAGLLELFYREVHPRFFEKEMPPIRLYLINGGEEFEEFVSERGYEEHRLVYGFYTGGEERAIYARRYFSDGRASGVGTLFHELNHAFVDAELGQPVASWFNEGFSSLFERGRIIEGRWVYGNPNPWRDYEFRAHLEAGRVPTLEDFFQLDEQAFSKSRDLYYNTGRSFFLMLLRRGEEYVVRFVREYFATGDGKAAAEQTLGTTLDDIELSWRESLTQVNRGGFYAFSDDGATLAEGVKLHPDYGFLRHVYARWLIEVKRHDEALVHTEAALEDPRFIFPQAAWFNLGFLLWTDDPTRSLAAFERVRQLQPWCEQIQGGAYRNLAALLRRAERDSEADAVDAELARLEAEDSRN